VTSHDFDRDGALVKLASDGLSVTFGHTKALSEFEFEFRAGEIIGLLGHNGAGKSTFVNAVTGAVTKYEGRLFIAGVEVPPGAGPRELAQMGISVLFQEPALVGTLSVKDNLFLGHHVEPSEAAACEALTSVGARFLLDQPVSSLTLGQRQIVALARGLLGGQPEVLLLDEPTAALGRRETDALHDVIRQFADSGTAVVYVSHRLRDIFDVCNRVVVLQGGRQQIDRPISDVTMGTLTSALAPGLDQSEAPQATREPSTSPEVLRVQERRGNELSFGEGEIVGLFGMAAGAQYELLDRLFGLDEPTKYELDGAAVHVSRPFDALKRGIHLVPADREKDGVLGNLSAFDNVFLPWLREPSLSSAQDRQELYAEIREKFGIQGPPGTALITAFSGGNRQKHLLSQPTQGVDVQAKQDIRRVIGELAEQGTTVLVASAEADEIASLCSRSYVFGATACHNVPGGSGFDSRLMTSLLEDRNVGVFP
jgi:ABC-type sugar transport system ATPase subunit